MQPSSDIPPAPLLQTIVAALDSLAGVERIWRHGLVHRGGPHYRLRGTTGPASIGEDECHLLGRLITRFAPSRCFVIGNGFGLSSVWIAKRMEATGGQTVVTLDNRSEGDGDRCFSIAAALTAHLECRILRNAYGASPRDLALHAQGERYDLIFIDGNHAHPHVVHDFRGAEPLLSEHGIVCWHDYWLPGVAESVADAQRRGMQCWLVRTSCEMVFGTRSPAVHAALRTLFESAEAPRRRWHPWARLRLTSAYLSAQLQQQRR